mmetsp:Transcript_116264/g.290275  ORF Transcript_116264/g.290275 Transcript_116264/m.290275 type:complete len:213 (+) Transcript_116264:582-1220(+)
MSAYTDNSGLRLKHNASIFFNLRSNQRWMFMTGIPSNSSNCRKNGIVDQPLGTKRFKMSTGTAETYSSASTTSPPRSTTCFTELSLFSTMESKGAFKRTCPPSRSMCSTIGAHKRSGWFPSKNAVWLPSVSLMNRFMAVSTTVIESRSGSMKSSAFAIGMKISLPMRSGMPYFCMKSFTDSSSWASIKLWPATSIGSNGGPVCSFSSGESMS